MSSVLVTVPVADYVLGCDVSKQTVDVALVDSQGAVQWADKVLNDPSTLAIYFLTMQGVYPTAKLKVVVEATGIYHYPAIEAATLSEIGCIVYNPILTKQQIKSSVRGAKTDKTDAIHIARIGLRGDGRLYTPEPYFATKHYARSAQKLSGLSNSCKRYHAHITGLLGDELSLQTKELMAGIQDTIITAKRQLVKDMAASANGKIFTRLQTIPGIGPYVAASLIGEIQTIERFKTAKALTAYAGLDPKIFQSGHTLNSTGRITKRGSTYLRRSIFIAASVARQHDPNLKAFYEKKRNEGKSYKVANVATARKLLTVVRAVWLHGKDYDVEFSTRDSDLG
jgi:transposase